MMPIIISSAVLVGVLYSVSVGNRTREVECHRCGRKITAPHGHAVQWKLFHDCR